MKKNKVKPTLLQKRTLEIKRDNPKMPLGKAMLQAGYSAKSAIAPKENFLERRGTQVAIEEWREQLRGLGLGEDKLQKKYAEWLEAKKIVTSPTEPDKVVPDYQIQIKAGEMLREDLGIKQSGNANVNVQVNNNFLKEKRDKYGI